MAKLKHPVGPEDHVQGPPDAPVTLVEYGDYQCPYCGAAYPVLKRVQEALGDRLRFVFRNFPITQMHPEALRAASVAEFAGAHGRYWEVHDYLYEHQTRLGPTLYERAVTSQGLSAEALDAALRVGTFEERIRNDFNDGVRSGVNGTPSFFINGERYDGGADFEEMVEVLRRVAS